jgi:AcrB/AcrD/AcrF family protein
MSVLSPFIRAVDGSVELSPRSLDWVLRHETLTLLVTAATLVATIWLYIIIPKGFLPLQDTGLIFAVMEGGQEISFREMKRLQAEIEEGDRLGAAQPARHNHHRRSATEPVVDALYHPGRLPRDGAPEDTAEPSGAAADRARAAGRAGAVAAPGGVTA